MNLAIFSSLECADISEVGIITGNPGDIIIWLWSTGHDVPLSLIKVDGLAGGVRDVASLGV